MGSSSGSEFNPIGKCDKHYRGVLCASCEANYTKNSNFECNKCPSKVKNIARLVAIFVIAIGIIVFIIRSTLIGAKEKKNINSIYIKILLNHV